MDSIADGSSIAELHAEGLEAYGPVHAALTSSDPAVVGVAYERMAHEADLDELKAALPAPSPSIPLWVLSGAALDILDVVDEPPGSSKHGGTLDEIQVPGTDALRTWRQRNERALYDLGLAFEPYSGAPTGWRAWHRGTPDAVDLDLLIGRGEQVAAVFERALPRESVLLALARDWHVSLGPFLDALGLTPDEIIDACRNRFAGRSGTKLKTAPIEHVINEVATSAEVVAEGLGVPAGSAVALLIAAVERAGMGEDLPLLTDPDAVRAALSAPRSRRYEPDGRMSHDYWTTTDRLGHEVYAEAITAFIRHRDTRAPLTIGIKGPWGIGKTSVMRMVRKAIDPQLDARGQPVPPTSGGATGLATRELRRRLAGHDDDVPPAATVRERLRDDERATVWFNPWTYESSEELWAGLALAIFRDITARMTAREREDFWLRVNLGRVDRPRLRQRIHTAMIRHIAAVTLPVALVTLVLAVPLAAAFLPASSAASGSASGIVTMLTAGGAWAWRRRDFLQQPVSDWTEDLIRAPDYDDRAGFLHQVREDLGRAINLVATPAQPLVVFIDDLDRCNGDVVTEVIEALNLFLSGEYPDCLFVLAIEPDVVAAHVESARKDLIDTLASHLSPLQSSGLGWRFLAKMVQLPLRVPAPEPGQMEDFLRQTVRGGDPRDAVDEDAILKLAEEIRTQAERVEDLKTVAQAVQHPDRAEAADGGGGTSLSATRIRAAELELDRRLTDDDPELIEMVSRHAKHLSRNPREVKRYLNSFRFLAFVQVRRDLRDLPALSLDEVGVAAVLIVRWPHLLTALADASTGRPALLTLQLAANEGAEAWDAALDSLGLPAAKTAALASESGALRLLLTDAPPLDEAIALVL